MNRTKGEYASERISRLQGEVFSIWKQLGAFAFLLDRQAEAAEGIPELQGLGVSLRELSERLNSVWQDLDLATFPTSDGPLSVKR